VRGDAAAAVDAALRDDPPVRVMRRVAARATRIAGVDIAAGESVELDVAAAGRESGEVLAFGVPPRVCPGRECAVALAVGLVAAGLRQ
jgi:cytochrome P450